MRPARRSRASTTWASNSTSKSSTSQSWIPARRRGHDGSPFERCALCGANRKTRRLANVTFDLGCAIFQPMQWTDDGLILGLRRHGETSVVLELFTRAHGRHLGLVRGGRSRRLQATLQPGNSVSVTWRARLDDHLGAFVVEPLAGRAGRLMARADALHGVGHLGYLLRLLPERDPHQALYETAEIVAEHLDDPAVAPALLARLELAVLDELGFGLDLSSCAATGETDDLVYVSPKSGRAVGRAAGAPYAAKLFPLPPFLLGYGANASPTADDVAAAFAITGHFLDARVWEPRGIKPPESRAAYLALLGRAAA